jgi:hypothetical protein
MTYVTCTPPLAATLRVPDAMRRFRRPDRRFLLRHLRALAFAACLSLPAAMILHAEEAPQAWVPEALSLPADADVLTDRAIGSNIRMFSFSTARDPDELIAEWEEALSRGGYTINRAQDALPVDSIEFSGEGISNAKIIVSPTTDGERAVIEFDATLE